MSENHAAQKGLLILSMPRAGSNWLASLSNSNGAMGIADEWLDFSHLTAPKGPAGRPQLNAQTLASAATPNGNFAVKIFPRQLLQVIDEYEFDFIRRAHREHKPLIILLERKDRIAQAISLVRAMQTGQWTGTDPAHKKPRYNFGAISQAYFHICRGYDFWETYLSLQGFQHEKFTYEALQENTQPYLETLASHFNHPMPEVHSTLHIQRDPLSKAWRAQFDEDLKNHGIPSSTYQQKQPEPGFRSAVKVLRGKPAKISRFGYSF